MTRLYTPDLAGSGQFGICAHCGLDPTPEGRDGCIGTLPEHIVMNACCGHGNRRQAYLQYWTGAVIRGEDAIEKMQRLGVEPCSSTSPSASPSASC